jgi:hypothetical protein
MYSKQGKTVAKLVIESKRPNAKDWGIRNDRLENANGGKPFEARFKALYQEAENQVSAWMAVEPLTEFRIVDRSF